MTSYGCLITGAIHFRRNLISYQTITFGGTPPSIEQPRSCWSRVDIAMNMIQASVFTVHGYTVVPRDQIIFRGRKLVHYDSLSFVHSFIHAFIHSFIPSCIITHDSWSLINSFIIINHYESLSCTIIHCHWSSLYIIIIHDRAFMFIHYRSLSISIIHSLILSLIHSLSHLHQNRASALILLIPFVWSCF